MCVCMYVCVCVTKNSHVRQYSRQDTVTEGVLYKRALYRRAMYRRRALHSRGHCTGGGTVHAGGTVHVQKRRGGGQGRARERRTGQGRAGQCGEPRSGGGHYLLILLLRGTVPRRWGLGARHFSGTSIFCCTTS